MVREMTLRSIKEAFSSHGYVIKHKTNSVDDRHYDVIEAIKSGGLDATESGIIHDIFAVCTCVYNDDVPRLHRIEFFTTEGGTSMGEHQETGNDTFVPEVRGLIERSGLPW